MIYGVGISKVGEILDLAVDLEIARKSGAWFYSGDMRLGQGRENAKKYLLDNRDLMDEMEKKIREKSDEVSGLFEDSALPAVTETAESPEAPAADATETPDKPAAAPKAKKSKKTAILIEGEENFEEFSPDEL
jgi:recombination protein RecA